MAIEKPLQDGNVWERDCVARVLHSWIPSNLRTVVVVRSSTMNAPDKVGSGGRHTELGSYGGQIRSGLRSHYLLYSRRFMAVTSCPTAVHLRLQSFDFDED